MNPPPPARSAIGPLRSNVHSHFRSWHTFDAFTTVDSVESFRECLQWARERQRQVYILGNGSNTLFARNRVRSLVVKNALPAEIRELGEGRWHVSSSTPLVEVLTYCRAHSLDSFYYLAAVPGTVGGALAMNAGRGQSHHQSIYDFVESVTFVEEGEIKTAPHGDIFKDYRRTTFSGVQSRLILSAIFRFPRIELPVDPIVERLKWVKAHQDNTAPNCGSVFAEADSGIMTRLRGVKFLRAAYSPKVPNWILSHSQSSFPIRALVALAVLLHSVTLKKIRLELVVVP